MQVESGSKTSEQFIILWFQANCFQALQRGLNRLNLHRSAEATRARLATVSAAAVVSTRAAVAVIAAVCCVVNAGAHSPPIATCAAQ